MAASAVRALVASVAISVVPVDATLAAADRISVALVDASPVEDKISVVLVDAMLADADRISVVLVDAMPVEDKISVVLVDASPVVDKISVAPVDATLADADRISVAPADATLVDADRILAAPADATLATSVPVAPSVALVASSVVALASALAAAHSVELASPNSVDVVLLPEVLMDNSILSANKLLEDVPLLRLRLMVFLAVLDKLEELLSKVSAKMLVPVNSLASPTIPLTPLSVKAVLPSLQPNLVRDLVPLDSMLVLMVSSMLVPLKAVLPKDRLLLLRELLLLPEELLLLVLVAVEVSPVDSVLALPSVSDAPSELVTSSPTESSMTEDVASSVVPLVPSSELASADVEWTDVVPTR